VSFPGRTGALAAIWITTLSTQIEATEVITGSLTRRSGVLLVIIGRVLAPDNAYEKNQQYPVYHG
jgi:hypothetical protein